VTVTMSSRPAIECEPYAERGSRMVTDCNPDHISPAMAFLLEPLSARGPRIAGSDVLAICR
jgi:hypothetical protein